MKHPPADQPQTYITTAIPYVNARAHIGQALEFLYADVLARYWRRAGHAVLFVTGVDEHGQKIARVAAEKGVTPQEHVDELAQSFQALLEVLNISNDDFIRTTEERHQVAAQEFWRHVAGSGDLEKDTYEGLYCVGCEAYKTEKELVDGKCPDHGTVPESIKEENYFFRLSRYSEKLLEYFEQNPTFVLPNSRFNEMKELVKGGLEDISVSREREHLSWGVPVPDDDSQVMYVWFEALINYLSAAGFGADEEAFGGWWPAQVHVVGKDINRFHSVMWPAMLMAAGLPLPHQVAVHGHITVDGQKMSKTLGNVVDPFELVARYGVDPVRYFLLREIPFHRDGDFSHRLLAERYTSDLANGIGNLLSRVTNMVEKYFQGELEAAPRDDSYQQQVDTVFAPQYEAAVLGLEFHRALHLIWEVIDGANEYIDDTKPWALAKTDHAELARVLAHLLFVLEVVGNWLDPFLPETAEKIRAAVESDKIVKAEPLFPRLEE